METLYRAVIQGLKEAATLEKQATASPNSQTLTAKTNSDWTLFQQIKEAGIGQFLSTAAKHPFGKGLMLSTGAAIPAAAAGSYIAGRAGNEARQTTEDARNKALQVALALGAIGTGLYGVHRATQNVKQGSLNNSNTLIEKLATTGFLDTVLENLEKTATFSDKIDTTEFRRLNAEHGISILRDLLDQ